MRARAFGQRGQRQPQALRRVRGQYASRAGIADRDQIPAPGPPPVQVERGRVHQILRVVGAPDTQIAQKRVHPVIFDFGGAGMRACGALAAFGAAGFQRHDGQIARVRNRRRLGQLVRIVDGFEVQQQQLDVRILSDMRRQFRHRDIGLVAGGMTVAHADMALMQKTVDQLRQGAALADDRNRPGHAGSVVKNCGKIGDGAGAEARTTATLTPRRAHCSTACTVPSPASATIAISGTSGSEARSGYALWPCTSARAGLIGKIFPL